MLKHGRVDVRHACSARMLSVFSALARSPHGCASSIALDTALRTLSGGSHAARALPAPGRRTRAAERRGASAGRRADAREPCRRGLRAGAVQRAGAGHARPRAARASSSAAAREETDHLAWTQQRLRRTRRPAQPAEPAVVRRRLRDRPARRACRRRARAWASSSRPSARSSSHLEGHLDRLPAARRRVARHRRADARRRSAPCRRRRSRRGGRAAGTRALGDARGGAGDDEPPRTASDATAQAGRRSRSWS